MPFGPGQEGSEGGHGEERKGIRDGHSRARRVEGDINKAKNSGQLSYKLRAKTSS